MTDDGIYAEIDASKAFAQGQALQVISLPYNMYGVKFKNSGTLPSDLDGSYTSVEKAIGAISGFLTTREAHFDHVERKKAAKRPVKKKVKED